MSITVMINTQMVITTRENVLMFSFIGEKNCAPKVRGKCLNRDLLCQIAGFVKRAFPVKI